MRLQLSRPTGRVSTATPDSELNAVLTDLLTALSSALADRFVGMYLHGSAAIGDLDRHGDVDFVVVIGDEIDERTLAVLQSFHARVYNAQSSSRVS